MTIFLSFLFLWLVEIIFIPDRGLELECGMAKYNHYRIYLNRIAEVVVTYLFLFHFSKKENHKLFVFHLSPIFSPRLVNRDLGNPHFS